MKRSIRVLAILLILAILIGLPPVFAGYYQLNLAETLQTGMEASLHYESAARLLPWRSGLYEMAALANRNEMERSMRLLLLAREKDTLSPAGQLALGDAYLANSNPQQAVEEWNDLFAREVEIQNSAVRLTQFHHQTGDYGAETKILQRWLILDPGNKVAGQKLGKLLASEGSPDALAVLQTATQDDPNSQLEPLVAALLESTSNRAYNLTRSGQALAGLGEWPLAEIAFQNAVNANAQYAEAWAWLGLARQQNQHKEALAALEKALQLQPNSPAIHTMLGTVLQQNGKLQEALEQFKIASQIEPENPAWWQAMGGALAPYDLPGAVQSYVHAIKLAPENASYWYALAVFCVENNAFLEEYGLSAALRAYALQPGNPDHMDILGRAQMAFGQTKEAEVMYKKAISASGPGNPTHIYMLHLGLLYLQTGREAEAKSTLIQVKTLDPAGIYGLQAKKLLERYFP
jgi:tetratricopeptide (TPR) repeat protein